MENPDSILKHLADLMRPMLINSLKERRKKIFTENADRMKRLMDDLQKKLDEVGPNCFNYSFIFHWTINVCSVLLTLMSFLLAVVSKYAAVRKSARAI